MAGPYIKGRGQEDFARLLPDILEGGAFQADRRGVPAGAGNNSITKNRRCAGRDL